MNQNIQNLNAMGQCLWLDNIDRKLLISGMLDRYIRDWSVKGLSFNIAAFAREIGSGSLYDETIHKLAALGLSSEEAFLELALEDVTQAADLFRSRYESSDMVDGWVSLDISPFLANDAATTTKAVTRLHLRAARHNLTIKVPGTREGLLAIEQSIFDGVPVNVTLLFSREHYIASAEAYVRGIERRIAAGRPARVESVASVSIQQWDLAEQEEISPAYRNRLGIAIAMRVYEAHLNLLSSHRWRTLAAAGARPQRLVWVDMEKGCTENADLLYIEALSAAGTIAMISERKLLAFADHGISGNSLTPDSSNAEAVIQEFRREGIDEDVLAARLQKEGMAAAVTSWGAAMAKIRQKSLSPGTLRSA
jgi:transaldolase